MPDMRSLITTPLGWAVLLLLGVLVLWGLRRLRRRPRGPGIAAGAMALAVGASALVVVAANPTVADLLVVPLETTCDDAPQPDWARRGEPPEAILVLSAGFEGRSVAGGALSRAGLERTVEGVAAAARWPAAAIVFSGGPLDPSEYGAGQRMGEEAVRMGVAPGRVHVESLAQTTRGNAVHGARLLRERGWERIAVVTSATHMRRALGSLRAVDVDALPLCAGRRVVGGTIETEPFPRANALVATTEALHERLGLVYYRLRGWLR